MQSFTIQEDLKNATISYYNVASHSTICAITFKNNFEVIGSYSCARDEVDNNILRQNRSYENALKNYQKHFEKRNDIYGGN